MRVFTRAAQDDAQREKGLPGKSLICPRLHRRLTIPAASSCSLRWWCARLQYPQAKVHQPERLASEPRGRQAPVARVPRAMVGTSHRLPAAMLALAASASGAKPAGGSATRWSKELAAAVLSDTDAQDEFLSAIPISNVKPPPHPRATGRHGRRTDWPWHPHALSLSAAPVSRSRCAAPPSTWHPSIKRPGPKRDGAGDASTVA